jgi:hypothetical protein
MGKTTLLMPFLGGAIAIATSSAWPARGGDDDVRLIPALARGRGGPAS